MINQKNASSSHYTLYGQSDSRDAKSEETLNAQFEIGGLTFNISKKLFGKNDIDIVIHGMTYDEVELKSAIRIGLVDRSPSIVNLAEKHEEIAQKILLIIKDEANKNLKDGTKNLLINHFNAYGIELPQAPPPVVIPRKKT